MEAVKEELAQNRIITGYELSTAVIRKGFELGLSRSGLQVLIYLCSCYNGKPVFPVLRTLAQCTLLSMKGVQLAIEELVTKGLILKSHRKRNNACTYAIASKVLDLVEFGSKCQTGLEVATKPMNMKLNKEKLSKNHHHDNTGKQESIKSDDVLSSNSSKKHAHVSIEDVPEIIKGNKDIKNPCAYWASLNAEAREAVLKDNEKLLQKRSKIVEFRAKKIQEEKQVQEQEQRHLEVVKKPLSEQMTREEALEYIRRVVKTGQKRMYSGNSVGAQIIQAFGFDIDKIKSGLNNSGSSTFE